MQLINVSCSAMTTGTLIRISCTPTIKTMAKFKDGDKVKVIGARNGSEKLGRVGIVIPGGGCFGSSDEYLHIRTEGCGDYNVYSHDLQLINNNTMRDKLYRVNRATPAWEEGAIIKKNDNGDYQAINDIWNVSGNDEFNKFMEKGTYHEVAEIVENSPEWFERVYKVSSLKGMLYVVKGKMKEIMSKTAVDADGKVEGEQEGDKE